MDGILCSEDEVEWLASITTHSPLRQRLQNARQLMQGAPNQMYLLTEWADAAIHTMWLNAAELWYAPVWHTYAEVMQAVRELRLKQLIFNPNTQSPDGKCFTGYHFEQCPIYHSWIPDCYSCTLCGAPIYKVTSVVASLGEIERTEASNRD